MSRRCTFTLFALAAMPLAAVVAAGVLSAAMEPSPQREGLRKSLTFHSAFDGKHDAAYAAGDPTLYHAPALKQRQDAKPGLPDVATIQLASRAGRFGDALRFTAKKSPVVFFRGFQNIPYEVSNWNG